MKKISYILLLSFLSFYTEAQSLYPSKVKFEIDTNDRTINAISGAGIVQVSEGSSEIAFKLDVSTITSGIDEVDSLLSSLKNQFIYLKGSFPAGNLNFNNRANESPRNYFDKAYLTINGVTQLIYYSCNVFIFNNNDDEFSVGNTVYPLRINLFFSFEPKDYKLDKLYPNFDKLVKVEVANGLINRLNLAGDSIFKN